MWTKRGLLASSGLLALGALLFGRGRASSARSTEVFPVSFDETTWRQRLTPAQFDVLRREGTEWPGSSRLNAEHRRGLFACAGCSADLFASETKFDSGTGWPSFYAPLDNAVATTTDRTLGMARTEVHCRTCGGHLGHVFDDGPKPTGLRYCMNGVAMTFKAAA